MYDNIPIDFARVDNKLAAAQMDIGESSNVAQIGLSYSYNQFGKGYEDYIVMLAIDAQISIDSAKKCYDVDIHSEIKRLKNVMDVKQNGYPVFFAGIRPDLRSKVNPKIQCPMNCVYKMKNKQVKYTNIIPNTEFFIKHENTFPERKSRRVEKLIEDYSLEFYIQIQNDEPDWFLLRSDYEDLIAELRSMTLSKNYLGLMAWLIDRALMITPDIRRKKDILQSKLSKNRSLLLKVLYDINPKTFKKCFKNAVTQRPM